jgi:Ca-activated chloride channel family protein
MARLSLVCALCASLAALPARQQFHASVDLVHLPVMVMGRAGEPVHGLKAGDFEVLEDGTAQQIAFFSEGDPGDVLPLHLGLLLDTSESMERDLKDAATAAVQFIGALEAAADVTFIDFDTSVRVARFSPPSYPMLFERMRARKAGGMTALYDAIAVFLESAARREGQHVLVLYSDGGDSTSTITWSKLDQLLRLSGNVIVYCVGYLENQSSSSRTIQQMRIVQIASETGGNAFFPASGKEIPQIYRKILDELESRYTIGYVSSNTRADGKFRKVQVNVVRPEVKNVKIRTRPGYYARPHSQ